MNIDKQHDPNNGNSTLNAVKKKENLSTQNFNSTTSRYRNRGRLDRVFWNIFYVIDLEGGGGGGGGGYLKKFYTGRLRPEVQPLTLLYTIFSEKAPLSYTFL